MPSGQVKMLAVCCAVTCSPDAFQYRTADTEPVHNTWYDVMVCDWTHSHTRSTSSRLASCMDALSATSANGTILRAKYQLLIYTSTSVYICRFIYCLPETVLENLVPTTRPLGSVTAVVGGVSVLQNTDCDA